MYTDICTVNAKEFILLQGSCIILLQLKELFRCVPFLDRVIWVKLNVIWLLEINSVFSII